MTSVTRFVSVSLMALLLLAGASVSAKTMPQTTSVWQFSVPMEKGTERRAYLWIPPTCKRVRGVLFGLQNMLERPMFEDPEIRSAAIDSDLAIVWVSPGAWPGKLDPPEQPSLKFTPREDAVKGVQRVLTDLAHESGYKEIEFAPLLVTGHSAASPFVWGMADALPNRVFAILPYKSSNIPGLIPLGVPTLYVAQDWAEWSDHWGEFWHKEIETSLGMRRQKNSVLLGDFVDLGAGHFDWHSESASVLATFIRKAVQYRIPAQAPLDGPVALKPISIEDGVLVAPKTLGTEEFKAVPYREWKGDPGEAFWYFDREMAIAVNHSMQQQLGKKPQAIDFIVDGHPVPLVSNGFAPIRPEFLSDGVTFRVHADFLSTSPTVNLFGGATLGHADGAITYCVSSGALRQVGADTFQVAARSGGLFRQGMPWEPWIMAYQPGNAQYKSADKPAHILIDVRNKKGVAQTINFPRIADVKDGIKQIKVSATANSGLPVQIYVESGPAVVAGNTISFLPLPPRTQFPVRVIVSAYQWGRVGNNPVQSAGPETQEFFIQH